MLLLPGAAHVSSRAMIWYINMLDLAGGEQLPMTIESTLSQVNPVPSRRVPGDLSPEHACPSLGRVCFPGGGVVGRHEATGSARWLTLYPCVAGHLTTPSALHPPPVFTGGGGQ